MMKSTKAALLCAALMAATPALAQDEEAAPPEATATVEASVATTPVADAAAEAPAEQSAPAEGAAPAEQPAPAEEAAPAADTVPVAEALPAEPAAQVFLTADGKVPAAPEGKGQVVFYRPAKLIGAALTFSVRENDAPVAKVGNGRYYVVVADPGEHAYQMKGEVTDTLNLEVDAGETYYVETGIGVGIVAGRPNMTPSDQAAFEAISKKLKPAKPVKQES